MPAPHPLEFRQRAVELARQGATPVSKIAKDSVSASPACGTGCTRPTLKRMAALTGWVAARRKSWRASAP